MKKQVKWKNIIRLVLLILCGILLGVNVYLANANSLVGNQLPMPFGYGAAVVLSGSMEPTLSKGDLIVVEEADSYAVDDMVVYQDGRSLVVHRVIEITEEGVITQGDANNTPDAPVEAKVIKGKVWFYIPWVGELVNLLKTPIGTIVILASAILLVEIPRRREKQKDDMERQKIIDEIKRLKDQD